MLIIENYDIAFSTDPSDNDSEVLLLVIEKEELPSFSTRPTYVKLNKDFAGNKSLDVYFNEQNGGEGSQEPKIRCSHFPEELYDIVKETFEFIWMCTVDNEQVVSEDKLDLLK